jgi:hypothetical protein
MAGAARLGRARHGWARHGRQGLAGRGLAWQGEARQGRAWQAGKEIGTRMQKEQLAWHKYDLPGASYETSQPSWNYWTANPQMLLASSLEGWIEWQDDQFWFVPASNIAAGELDEYRDLHKKNQEEIYRLRRQIEELQGRHDALDEATKQAQELDMGY